MPDLPTRLGWRVIGASVRGSSHRRWNLPNQDAIAWDRIDDGGPSLILALSDGHGSRRCFRSHVGARLAVQTAVETLRRFARSLHDETNLRTIKRIADDHVARRLVRDWRRAVEADLDRSPFSGEACECAAPEAEVNGPTENRLLAYGATLMAVLVTASYAAFWQIGDGDIRIAWPDHATEAPVPGDARLIGNETTSLCTEQAWRDFRFHFQPFFEMTPMLILCATDGYGNAFRRPEDFEKAVADFAEMAAADQIDQINAHLPGWLTDATVSGSGDDVTLGLICRAVDPFAALAGPLQRRECHRRRKYGRG